ncbi:MAG TPA: hypothetical protein VMM78_02785, partial [Thermomicrobiales bacterium]|nr:hypothetical protein [Thermomicrobiales bacterium]
GELALGGAGVGARDGAPAHDAERANAPPGEIASAAARSTGEAGSVAPDSGERQAAPARGVSDQQGDGIEAARRGATAEGESGSRNTDGEHRDVAGSGNEGWIVDVEIAAATDGGSPPGARAGAGDGVGRLADAAGGGPLGDPSPLVVSLFEAANDRRSSALERILLGELERDAEPAAGAAGSSGEEWVAAALREAVSSGSSFVAPKRVREIIARWSRETGGPGAGRTGTGERLPAGQPAGHAAPEHAAHPPARASPGGVAAGSKTVASSGAVRLPGGADGALIWDQALADLARALDRTTFERLLAGSALVRFRRGVVEVHVQSAEAAEKLSAEYRGLVERQLNARLPRPVAVTFLSEPSPVDVAGPGDASAADLGNLTIIISRADYDLATRVWQALRNDLASSLSARDLDGLGAVTPLGEDAAGAMLLGTATSRALRLVDGRCRPEIERALSALLGRPVTARAVSSSGWTVEPAD